MLGYRDSGMAGSEANANPDCFAAAPLDEATGRLVAVVRRTRPQVMVIYGDDQSGYPHPDHLRVHEAGLAAFRGRRRPGPLPRRRARPTSRPSSTTRSTRRPGSGPSTTSSRSWASSRRSTTSGGPGGTRCPRRSPTTVVDITGFTDVRREALLAHATQVDPKSQVLVRPAARGHGAPSSPHDDYRLAFVGDARRHRRTSRRRRGGRDRPVRRRVDGGRPVTAAG